MDHEYTPQHLATTLDHLTRYWGARRRQQAAGAGQTQPLPHPFTVAISREAGTTGTLLAREVGSRLGWQVYDHELLERIAGDMGLRTTLLDSIDERRQGWLTETFEAFLSAPTESRWNPFLSESAYVHHLVKTVLALGAHGECVIVGRGAPFLLPAETTLRVRLVAPLKHRVATLSRRLGIPEREAAHRVRTLDRERKDFIQDHFSRDPTDPDNHDLIINVSRFSVGAAADLIVESLRRLEAARTEEHRRTTTAPAEGVGSGTRA
jgi:cytidylate kinase